MAERVTRAGVCEASTLIGIAPGVGGVADTIDVMFPLTSLNRAYTVVKPGVSVTVVVVL